MRVLFSHLTQARSATLLVTFSAAMAAACGGDDSHASGSMKDAAPPDTVADSGSKQRAGSAGARAAHSAAGAAHSGSGGAAGSELDAGNAHDAGDDGPRSVTIRFRAKIGTADFACGRTYAKQGVSGVDIAPQDLRMYIQSLNLVTADGVTVPVSMDERSPWQTPDVALLDFEDGTGACYGGPETNTTITGHVPRGTYMGVSFANGVPDALNHGDPVKLPAPLQVTAMSWNWLLGFRFIKAEVEEVDSEDAGVGRGLFHLGSTGCSGNPGAGTIKCGKPNRSQIVLDHFDPDTSTIVIDVGALFSQVDLSQDAQCHSAGDACAPMFSSAGVAYDTGLPASSQKLYRIE